MVNFAGCSELVQVLAVVGGVVLYLAIGAFVGWIMSMLVGRGDDENVLIGISVIIWPLAFVVIVLYGIGKWIAMPFLAATREELRETEDRLTDRIERCCSDRVDLSDDVEEYSYNTSFKVGDVITGIVPQTDYNGNNISYKHLYQGCKCRVLTIDSSDSMEVILLDHKDKEAHRSAIGKTFTAPARNFTLVKKFYKKRKVVKGKKSKR